MVKINYICDACGEGEMTVSGSMCLMSNPPSYPHKCNKCGYEDSFQYYYPTTGYQEIDNG